MQELKDLWGLVELSFIVTMTWALPLAAFVWWLL